MLKRRPVTDTSSAMSLRISIVIPTFNAGSDLARLLRALRLQSPVRADEVIVVDSGSTDGTLRDA